jgi:hypothetical protein
MTDSPARKRNRKGLGLPNPPPLLPPLDLPAPALGGLLSGELDDLLDHAEDVLAEAWDSTYALDDTGRQPLLRQKIKRTQKAIGLLVRRLQNELTALP